MLQQAFIDEMKTVLEGKKAELKQKIGKYENHNEFGDSADENANEAVAEEVSQDLADQYNKELEMVEAALGKIDDGTFGVDADGNEISEERLRAIPWADRAI